MIITLLAWDNQRSGLGKVAVDRVVEKHDPVIAFVVNGDLRLLKRYQLPLVNHRMYAETASLPFHHGLFQFDGFADASRFLNGWVTEDKELRR